MTWNFYIIDTLFYRYLRIPYSIISELGETRADYINSVFYTDNYWPSGYKNVSFVMSFLEQNLKIADCDEN